MAGWVDGYMQAKFRGVEFYVRDAGYKTGRRKAKFQYPGVDRTDYEDLGQDDRVFSLSAYVIGDDYFDQRNRLEKALDSAGVGTLVHPYRGVQRVSVDDYSESENTGEGRIARFSITFSIEEQKELSEVSVNTKKKVLESKAAIVAVAKDDFVKNYSFRDRMSKAVSNARATIEKGYDAIDKAKQIAAANAEYRRKADSIRGKIIALSLNAEFLFDSFFDFSDFGANPAEGITFGATTANAIDQIREQRAIVRFADSPAVDTPVEIINDPLSPSYQIQQMIKFCALASEIGLIASAQFATVEDASEAGDIIFDDIDFVLENGGISDELFAALIDARGAVFSDLNGRSMNLPRLITQKIDAPTDVLSLCYHIYGSLDLEQEFIDRNRIIHPGFIPVEVPLQFKTGGNG